MRDRPDLQNDQSDRPVYAGAQAARARNEAVRLADAGANEQALRLLTLTSSRLRSAGLQQEAQALEASLPLVEREAYASDAANRKRLHYESHRRKRGR